MTSKVKNYSIAFSALLIALCFGCNDSQDSTEKAVLRGLSVKYWTVAPAPQDAQWYVCIESKDGILRKQKLGALSEIATVALQRQNDEYVLSVCDAKGSSTGCRLGREITMMPLLTFYPSKPLPPDAFILKGSEKEVSQDFTRLAQGETGVRLKVENQ